MRAPGPLGLRKSFGYGDRLGLATAGHLAAARGFGFASIFAQQSIREMTRTQRTPAEVMQAARSALERAGYDLPWGADADHLKTPEDVERTAAAGYCFFTIDPSAFVCNEADRMSAEELQVGVGQLEADGVFPDPGWQAFYLQGSFDLPDGSRLEFSPESLYRAAVKYARSIAHSAMMSGCVAQACGARAFELEISVDETESPTSPQEHLFYGLELRRRGVKVVSLAPRFVGEFEKGIDYRGDLRRFEDSLRQHLAIARYCGPYKISVHSGSDKFSVYPIIGRVCGELLHVKTAGTSYLEALRVVARQAPACFADLTAYCRGRFAADRQSYHISTTDAEIAALPPYVGRGEEAAYLDGRVGRQLLHVTFGSVLTTGRDPKGRPFKEAILETLEAQADLHLELLQQHFVKHLSLLGQG